MEHNGNGAAVASVQKQLKGMVDRGEMKLADLEKFSGGNYGVATWSQFINSKYKGKVDTVAAIAKAYLRRLKALESLAQTSQYQIAHRMYTVCQRRNEFDVIIARSGLGKTTVAEAYEQNYDDVIMISCIPDMTVTGVLDRIRDELGVEYKQNTRRQDKFDLIVNALRKRSLLIILDEANELDIDILNTLRMIHDDEHCGMILQGDSKLLAVLQSGGGKENPVQVYSRIRRAIDLPRPTEDDIRAYCAHREMPLNGDDEVLKYIDNLMKNAGEYRKLMHLLDEINDLHEMGTIKEAKPTLQNVKLAQQVLISGNEMLKRKGR